MARLPLMNVRRLPLRMIADRWAEEVGEDREVILLELRRAVLNMARFLDGEPLLEELPPDDQLPNADTNVDQDWLRAFCKKQPWPEPEFWFPRRAGAARQGRPSNKEIVLEKFRERTAAGRMEGTISAEARAIHNDLIAEQPGLNIPEPKTIQGHIRDGWHGEE